MNYPSLYRKRIIPEECTHLKDDEILHLDERLMITRWRTLKPRTDFHHGVSCYFFKEGFKISKFYHQNGNLVYWYCDIISTEYIANENKLIITDLLADVVIYPDGFVRVLDVEELVWAHTEKKLSTDELTTALSILGSLLKVVYSGNLTRIINDLILLAASGEALPSSPFAPFL